MKDVAVLFLKPVINLAIWYWPSRTQQTVAWINLNGSRLEQKRIRLFSVAKPFNFEKRDRPKAPKCP